MSAATSRALRLQQLVREDASWRLLRAGSAPVIAALLAEHLAGDRQRVNADELYQLIDTELEELRGQGFDLPRNARGYVAEWREAGFVLRRASEESRGETFELSSAGLSALRFVDALDAPRQALTESRLANLSVQLRQLAIDTDPQSQRRIERLEAERERMGQQIDAIRSGQDDPLSGPRALERIRELLTQAAEVPDDFARVRAEFEQLNSTLRARIVESDESQRDVLDAVFRGVDLISESDAGRSFSGFAELLLDPALGTAFEDDIAQVLNRDFATALASADRRALRQFFTMLKDRSAEIQSVITVFARGLRRYVQSQDYRRDRVLRGLLLDAMHRARDASTRVRPWTLIGVEMELTAVRISSVGALSLHDPSEFDATSAVTVHEPAVASLEELRELARLTEIDFDELRDNVNVLIASGSRPTVSDVLGEYPATQGVASVVGLLSLAVEQGVPESDSEIVNWSLPSGERRRARIDQYRFVGSVA